MQGTNEDPLFNCLDVLRILGCKEANDNKFYQTNKSDPDLVVILDMSSGQPQTSALTNSQGSQNLCDGVVNQHSNIQRYFTETGLYECLFASDSSIARAFRREVIPRISKMKDCARIQEIRAICQSQSNDLEEAKRTIQSFNQYKEMLSVSHFLFQDKRFKIYGSNDNPLFLVNDIICDLLGMDRPSDNRFFKDHKRDARYVMMGQIATSSPDLQERFKKSNKNHIYFFTESGLYKCLMRSNKPIAELFQDEVIQLLKNIRLGVVGIHILNEEELKRQLQEKDALLQALQQQVSDQLGQIESLQEDNTDIRRKFDLTETDKEFYQVKVEGTDKVYGGQSDNAGTRFKQHVRKSSNSALRELSRERSLSLTVVARIPCHTRDDVKYAESRLIQSIPAEKHLNVVMPKYDLARVVNREAIEAAIPLPETPAPIQPSISDVIPQALRDMVRALSRSRSPVSIPAREAVREDLPVLPAIPETADVHKCPSCHRTVTETETRCCEKCLEGMRRSKEKRLTKELPLGKKLCPRCSCIRDQEMFVANGKELKSCIKCRERNIKASQRVSEHNSENPDTKLCGLCHKPNTNDKSTCDVCLEKKKNNRKRCIHGRPYEQCPEDPCIENSKTVCKVHRKRLPCGQCKKSGQSQ